MRPVDFCALKVGLIQTAVAWRKKKKKIKMTRERGTRVRSDRQQFQVLRMRPVPTAREGTGCRINMGGRR